MDGIWNWLVNPAGLTPHGFCLTWAPGLIWMHAVSDIVIGLAYFSIPVALTYFLIKRKDLEFQWMAYLFVAFILACGMTHFMSVYVLWVAAYGAEGILKAVTALLSVGTAILLWPLIPRLLALPSPTEMTALNAALSNTIEEQELTNRLLLEREEEVRLVNAELEARVAERTADLTAALQQRDLLLREVYHRVKNNLQIVDSMILLQESQLTDMSAKTSLKSLRSRVYALGLVHQQLMTSRDLQTFDFAPFLRELVENVVLSGASGKIELDVDACALDVNLDFAVPLGLLVTELVTNSIKHAFEDGNGKISVRLALADDGANTVVTVTDNGRGDVQDQQRSAIGLGKRLMKGLVQQLRGRMEVQWHNGTMARVTIPVPNLA